jgi:hypothetical protein
MRIGFFLRHRFHSAIMEPIYRQLTDRFDCRLFSLQPADLAHDPYGIRQLRPLIAEMIAFRPHVVVAGENIHSLRLRTYLPETLFVHTRHGLASKGTSYEAACAADYACVTSPFARQWFLDAGARPRRDFWVVGYPQMDPLFWPEPLPLPFALPPGKRVVLYAPTFQASLSSARLLGERTIALIRGQRQDVTIIIKPHPLIGNLFPQWLEQWQRLAAVEPDVHLVQDTHSDVMPYLQAADVLVTDLSSVALEFLALKRPMVLITSPHRYEEAYVDPNGLEWRWRDMGHEIFDVEQLPAAVSSALDDPAAGMDRRQHYHDLLFGDLADGQAGRRIADNIAALAGHTTADWRLSLSSSVGSMAVHAANWKQQIHTWRSTPPFPVKASAR